MEENTPTPSSDNSRTLPIIIAVIAILVVGGAAYALSQRNTTPTTTTETNQPDSAQDVVPTTTTGTTTTPADDSAMENQGEVKEFTITGSNFKFSEQEIRVNEGDTVKINFTSTGGFHDWVADEFNAKTEQVNPGKSTTVEFVANKKGEFEYYCSVGNHKAMGMIGKLIVE